MDDHGASGRQITASCFQENGQLSYWCPKPQFKTSANAQRNTELRQLEAFMASPQAFLLSFTYRY